MGKSASQARAMRRAAKRAWDREQRLRIESVRAGSNPSRPLIYRPGFIHEACGGEAERPNQRSLGAYCVECESHIPRSETRRENGEEMAARLSRPLWYQDQLDAMAHG